MLLEESSQGRFKLDGIIRGKEEYD